MTGLGSPCGACKFLRRKCVRGCVFAPYFCHENGAASFAAVHRVFGASNAAKLLAGLAVSDRSEAALTIAYEAQARLRDPVYGCVSHIFALQQQVVSLQTQLAAFKASQATHQTAPTPSGSSTTTTQAMSDQLYGNNPPGYPQDVYEAYNYQNAAAFYYNSGADGCSAQPGEQEEYCSSMAEESRHEATFEAAGETNTWYVDHEDQMNPARMEGYGDMEDLQSIAFAYLRHG